MKKTSLIGVVLLSLLLLSGCATGPVGTGIPSASKMDAHPQDDRALLYINKDVPKGGYSKFIIEPVQVYEGADNGFGDIPMTERRMMADFTQQEVTRILGEKFAVVDKSGPETMRIKLILVGVEKTNTIMRGLTYGNPMGLAMNLGKGALGKQGNFMGSVTLAGEFEDSRTGTTLAAFMGKISPFALAPTFLPWDAAEEGVRRFATDFRDQVERNRAAKK